MTNGGSTVGQYYYDSDGKRVKKVVPGTGETTIFVYDAAGKQIAEYSTIVADTSTAKVAYLTADHLGSPRINTDANGAVIARHDYHPFGEEISTSQRTTGLGYSGDSVRKQFTGYERDGETNLDFGKARYYANSVGRFESVDPENYGASVLDPQTWNAYTYVVNNPLVFSDPDGLEYKICSPTNECYTASDEQVRKAKEAGGFTWEGSRDKHGLESGTITAADGTSEGTFQQTSHDSQLQQMLWGSSPTLNTWEPVINALSPIVTIAGAPVTSAPAAALSVTRVAVSAAEAANLAKTAQLMFNGAKGTISTC